MIKLVILLNNIQWCSIINSLLVDALERFPCENHLSLWFGYPYSIWSEVQCFDLSDLHFTCGIAACCWQWHSNIWSTLRLLRGFFLVVSPMPLLDKADSCSFHRLLMTNHLFKTPVRLYPCKALRIHCLPIKNDITLDCYYSLLNPDLILFRRFYLDFSNYTLSTARLMLVLSISASKFLINKPSILLFTS